MKHLSPMDAQRSLKYVEENGRHLTVGHRRALETIANMREEWGIVAVYLGRHEVERWGFDTRDDALDEASALDLDELRVVRRYATEPEEA